MTRQKSFKRNVRTRMHKTGERYAAARRQLIERAQPHIAAQAGSSPQQPLDLGTSDEAVRRGSGRGWDDWLAILDAWGATGRRHPEIARWLQDEHGVDGWWAQSVTVGYERARGMRDKHQQSTGFAVGASRTIAATPERLSDAFTDPALRERWLPGADMAERTSRPGKSARFDWRAEGSIVVVGITPRANGKSQVALQHEKLPDAARAEEMKAFWRDRMDALKTLLEG